jgi:hypothetical protein
MKLLDSGGPRAEAEPAIKVVVSEPESEDNISEEGIRGELPRGDDENQTVRNHLGVRR